MGTGLRFSEEAYAALLKRTGSRAAPEPAAKAPIPVPRRRSLRTACSRSADCHQAR